MATTPVVLPGKSHGQRSLTGYNPRGCKESNTTEYSTVWGTIIPQQCPMQWGGTKQKPFEHQSSVCLLLCPVDTWPLFLALCCMWDLSSPDEGSNLQLLNWKLGVLPLDSQGSPWHLTFEVSTSELQVRDQGCFFTGSSTGEKGFFDTQEIFGSKAYTYNQKEMAIHSSILAWKILRTEEPGGLLSMGLQWVRHDLVTK